MSGGNSALTLGIIGSGKGSNAATIIREIEAGRLAARVGVVISDVADAGILELARAHGLAAVHLPPGLFKTKLDPENERRLVEILREHGVDLVVLAGFMRLLKQPMIEAFPRRIINIHPSLLPKFPGLAAWRQALEAGEREAGCTIHYVDMGMDTGAPIAQAAVPILEGDTPETLHARIQEAEHRLYPEVIARFVQEPEFGNES
jgi:phosphoribosylglycinamide formyltransferase-1